MIDTLDKGVDILPRSLSWMKYPNSAPNLSIIWISQVLPWIDYNSDVYIVYNKEKDITVLRTLSTNLSATDEEWKG